MFPTQYLMFHQCGTIYSPRDTPPHFLLIYLYRCHPIYLIHPSRPSSCLLPTNSKGLQYLSLRGKKCHKASSFNFSPSTFPFSQIFYNKIISKTLTYNVNEVETRDCFLAIPSFFRGFKPLIRMSRLFLQRSLLQLVITIIPGSKQPQKMFSTECNCGPVNFIYNIRNRFGSHLTCWLQLGEPWYK